MSNKIIVHIDELAQICYVLDLLRL